MGFWNDIQQGWRGIATKAALISGLALGTKSDLPMPSDAELLAQQDDAKHKTEITTAEYRAHQSEKNLSIPDETSITVFKIKDLSPEEGFAKYQSAEVLVVFHEKGGDTHYFRGQSGGWGDYGDQSAMPGLNEDLTGPKDTINARYPIDFVAFDSTVRDKTFYYDAPPIEGDSALPERKSFLVGFPKAPQEGMNQDPDHPERTAFAIHPNEYNNGNENWVHKGGSLGCITIAEKDCPKFQALLEKHQADLTREVLVGKPLGDDVVISPDGKDVMLESVYNTLEARLNARGHATGAEIFSEATSLGVNGHDPAIRSPEKIEAAVALRETLEAAAEYLRESAETIKASLLPPRIAAIGKENDTPER